MRNLSLDCSACFLGAGLYDHYVPAAVEQIASRGEFVTSYTPYQAEASQGTLQAIFEYQSMICELTGLDVSNASHYDGATACAEAVAMALDHSERSRVVFSAGLHPQVREVTRTYFRQLGVGFEEAKLEDGTTDPDDLRRAAKDAACVVVQSPNFFGCIEDLEALAAIAKEAGCVSIASVNPVSLAILKPPGACGFDIAAGDGQPLGVDPAFGGPTFGFMAARAELMRRMPGRIAGETVDAEGNRAFVLTLQAREQHIRRERASSNICTNQALVALRATIFLAGMGRLGLPGMADLCLQNAHDLAEKITALPGVKLAFPAPFFHEFTVTLPKPAEEVNAALLKRGIVGGASVADLLPDLRNPWVICATEKSTRAKRDMLVEALKEVLK